MKFKKEKKGEKRKERKKKTTFGLLSRRQLSRRKDRKKLMRSI
jgi:hypothetical protein